MKLIIATAAVAALASTASAAVCQNVTIPITVSARNGVFSIAAPTSNIDVTNFILNLAQQGANYTQSVLTGYASVSGSYDIAATYCTPDAGSSQSLQVLTHGIGFDRGYWNLPYNNYNYSYVNEAVDTYGFSTFAWDRLGIGMSSHGDPINEIQAPLEVAALAYLTNGLRAGNLEGCQIKPPQKIVHVGHSFGSEHTYLLTAMYPNISDGIALTGFSANGSFNSFFLLGSNFINANQIAALSAYPNGYLANNAPTGVQIDFFGPGNYDPDILTFAYQTGEPVTVGELLTISGEGATPNTFAGPVLIITGERDIPFCGGNCYGTGGAAPNIPEMAFKFIPNAQNPTAIIVPGTGHGLNLEYTHSYTYGTINNYFVQNRVGP